MLSTQCFLDAVSRGNIMFEENIDKQTFGESHSDLDVRKRIYETISKSPGLHFRELQRRIGVATGTLDYHVHFLRKHGMIRAEQAGGFLRYYASDIIIEEQEKALLSLLRQEKIRHILILLIEKKRANASQMAFALNISPSNLSFYLKTLQGKNLIAQKKKGRFRFYSVMDKKKIVSALLVHKSSFLDKMVDRFIEAWEE